MTARKPDLQIDGLGRFEPQQSEALGGVYCYKLVRQFRGNAVDLIVYPSRRGSPPPEKVCKHLKEMFDRFEGKLELSLADLPAKLRPLCRDYQIDIQNLAEADMASHLVLTNIKLQPDGKIECYAKNELVTDSLDIVIGFTKDMRIEYIHFDG